MQTGHDGAHGRGWLPDELLRKIVNYLPRSPSALLPLCAVSHAWRQAATRDAVWEPLCRQAVGGKPLLDRILGSSSSSSGGSSSKRPTPRGRYHRFFLQRRRALASYQPTLRSGQHTSSSPPSFAEPPPAGFFDPFLWVLELRDGAAPEDRLLYSCVLDMKDPQARGKLFTSAGASVVGQGIRLGLDVKARLAPSPPSSACASPTHAACASGAGAVSPPPPALMEAAQSGGGHGEEKDVDGDDSNDNGMTREGLRRSGSGGGAVGDEPPELVFRLWAYDRRQRRAACFLATRLETARPPGRWHGRHYDGPFSGPGGGPTTRVVLDETHGLLVQPTVDMVDQFDSRVYLMAVHVDLQLCQCQGDEPAMAAPQHTQHTQQAAALVGCGDWDVGGSSLCHPMWAAAAGGGCHCVPGSGLGMIPEEGTWILLHDLLTTKLHWC